MKILDVTNTANRIGHIHAERKGFLALVLTKLDKPIRRFDGKIADYQIEDIMLSKEDNQLACVKANDFTFWTKKELRPYLSQGKFLFEFLYVD